MRSPRVLAALSLLVLVPAAAPAGEYFVDVNVGADAGNCTSAAMPCQTISYALAVPGVNGRVLVAPGTYAALESFPLWIPDGVFLESVAGPEVTTILRTDPVPALSVTVDLRIDGPAASKGIEGFTINGNNLGHHYGVYVNSYAPAGSQPAIAPYVRNCRVQGFSTAGILAVAWGCCQGGTNRLAALIERNLVIGAAAMDGIVVNTVADDQVTSANDESILRNNIVQRCRVGIQIGSAFNPQYGPLGHGLLRTHVRHNTVTGSTGDGIQLSAAEAIDSAFDLAVRVEVANNIIVASGGFGVHEMEGDGSARWRQADAAVLASNLFFGNTMGDYFDADLGRAFNGAAELNAIPDLGPQTSGNLAVAAALEATGSLTLASPVIDLADPAYPVDRDIDGDRRPLGMAADIGADEVLVLSRGVFSSVSPVTPEMAVVFGQLAAYAALSGSSYVDPDPAIASHALVVYVAAEGPPERLYLVKDRSRGSVTLSW
jgi:hypothetical protein